MSDARLPRLVLDLCVGERLSITGSDGQPAVAVVEVLKKSGRVVRLSVQAPAAVQIKKVQQGEAVTLPSS